MVGKLVDTPAGPLLAINLEILESWQDQRSEWAKQAQHPSRRAAQLQQTRQVLKQPTAATIDVSSQTCAFLPRTCPLIESFAAQHNLDTLNTHECIHHSVVAGGHYSTSSPQFAQLRERDAALLEQLWQQAADVGSMSATERRLRWSGTRERWRGSSRRSIQVDPDELVQLDAESASRTTLGAVIAAASKAMSCFFNCRSVPHTNLKASRSFCLGPLKLLLTLLFQQ